MIMPQRNWSTNWYRYGWGGHEKDDAVKGKHSSIATYFRMNDPRTGRWFSMDPMTRFSQSPFASIGNNPINMIDPFGAEEETAVTGGDGSSGGSEGGFSNPYTYDDIIVEDSPIPDSRSSGMNIIENLDWLAGGNHQHLGNVGNFSVYGRYDESGNPIEYYAGIEGEDPRIVMGSEGLKDLAENPEKFEDQLAWLDLITNDVSLQGDLFADPLSKDALHDVWHQEATSFENWAYGILALSGIRSLRNIRFNRWKGFSYRNIRIMNKKLAGKIHPKTKVPFNSRGFPDFSKHLYKGGPNDVIIQPTGNRRLDAAMANKVAGYTSTPKGYIWHHHQHYGRMQLVKFNVHTKTGHTGGNAIWYDN